MQRKHADDDYDDKIAVYRCRLRHGIADETFEIPITMITTRCTQTFRRHDIAFSYDSWWVISPKIIDLKRYDENTPTCRHDITLSGHFRQKTLMAIFTFSCRNITALRHFDVAAYRAIDVETAGWNIISRWNVEILIIALFRFFTRHFADVITIRKHFRWDFELMPLAVADIDATRRWCRNISTFSDIAELYCRRWWLQSHYADVRDDIYDGYWLMRQRHYYYYAITTLFFVDIIT